MTRLLGTCALTALALGLSACASGGADDTPDPVIDEATGAVAAPRNLVLERLSFRSGNDGRAVDETYDLSVRTLSTQRADNGALTYVGTSRSDFGTGQTMRYDASTDQFSFDIDYAVDGGEDGPRIVVSETFGPLLLVTPSDFDGLDNGLDAVYLAAQQGSYANGAIPDFRGDVAEADRFITSLIERGGDDEAATELLAFIQDRTRRIENSAGFTYRQGDVTYVQFRIDGSAAPTRFVTSGTWEQPGDDGAVDFGHLVYGQRTDPNEMPLTGSATYNGTIRGHLLRQNTVEILRGGMSMQTDFASGRVDMSLDANIAYRNGEGGTEYIDYAEFTGVGSIDDAAFSGTMTGTLDRDAGEAGGVEALDGSFDGEFFGPTAQEAGGTFEFSGEDAAGVGSFVARDTGSDTTGN